MIGGICCDSWKLVCEYLTIYDVILSLVPSTRLFLQYNILDEKKYITSRRIGSLDPLSSSIRKGFMDGVIHWMGRGDDDETLDSMKYAMVHGHLSIVKYVMSQLIEGKYNSSSISLECYYASHMLFPAIGNGSIESMQYILSIKDKHPTSRSMFNNGQGNTTPSSLRDWLHINRVKWLSVSTIINTCVKRMHKSSTLEWIVDNICPSLYKVISTTSHGYTYLYCDFLLQYHDILKERDIHYEYPILMNLATYCSHEGMKKLCKDYPTIVEYDPFLNHNDFFDMLLDREYKICQWMIDRIPRFKDEFCYQLILDSKLDNDLSTELCTLHCDVMELIHDEQLYNTYYNLCNTLREKKHIKILNWLEEHIIIQL